MSKIIIIYFFSFQNINLGEHGKPLGRTMLDTKQLLSIIGYR